MHEQTSSRWPLSLTAAGFLAVGALVRLMPHSPNVTPLTAMALFAGAQFSTPVAITVAVAAIAVGDLALGWTPQNLAGYVAMALTALIGSWVRRRRASGRVVGGALTGSLLFFLLSNFGVWVEGWLYPKTWAGLAACYVAGLPFYRNQLLGDLASAAFLFGGFALVCRWRGWRVTQPSVAR